MEADGLFALEGIHVAGAEESMVEIREALEYYCINFLRPWLEEYFYQKVVAAQQSLGYALTISPM